VHRVETHLDEKTVKGLDSWREGLTPPPSRSEAVQILLEEQLFGEQRVTQTVPSSSERRPGLERLGALYVLGKVPGFGPVKFREMHDIGVAPQEAIEQPDLLPFRGRVGDKLRRAIGSLSPDDVARGRTRAAEQLKRAEENSASILVHGDAEYPKRVYASNNPVPVLYVRGTPATWDRAGAVAVVGSRNTREPYAKRTGEFVARAVRKEMLIVSGFAVGADSIGHRAARDAEGRTVCVMPCGLDKVFPPENRVLWEDLLAYPGAAFVSEFGFGQRASSLLLRKRNKLIVAFAQGVLVAQSAADGGAMNAYRFGREQRKPVATFKPDDTKDTTGNVRIAGDPRTGGVALGVDGDSSEFDKWIDRLSSLT